MFGKRLTRLQTGYKIGYALSSHSRIRAIDFMLEWNSMRWRLLRYGWKKFWRERREAAHTGCEIEGPLILYSKYRKLLNPEQSIKGSELAWQRGNKVVFTAPTSGKKYNVVIDSGPMCHDDALGLVYEAIFEDGSRSAVLADALEPIFSEKELAEVEEFRRLSKQK